MDNVVPGMYLIIVSKTNNSRVYNPMIVSVELENGQAKAGEVNSEANFEIGGNVAYAKSSEPSIDKKITGKQSKLGIDGTGNEKGNTLAVGDEVKFEIKTTVPSYSKQYENPKFEIKDKVSDGLDAPAKDSIVVKGDEKPLAENIDYTLEQNGREFTVKLTKNYLLSGNAAKAVTVEYSAILNKDAQTGFDSNTNTATIDYSNSPTEDKGHGEKKTYHYTFDIDGNVGGSYDRQGEEIIKVGVDSADNVITEKLFKDLGEVTGRLKGIEFSIFKADASGNNIEGDAIQTVTTDAKGLMNFTKLDAGNYIIQETNTPENKQKISELGYIYSDKKVPVVINAEFNADGTLKSYDITIDGNKTTTYEAKYEGDTVTVEIADTSKSGIFNNVKPGGLPSTGGMGTYVFMLVGIALVATAMILRGKINNMEYTE